MNQLLLGKSTKTYFKDFIQESRTNFSKFLLKTFYKQP